MSETPSVDLNSALILLPTSEGKLSGGASDLPWHKVRREPSFNFFNGLDEPRLKLIERLVWTVERASKPKLSKLFGCKDKRLSQATQLICALSDTGAKHAHTVSAPTVKAALRFTGVMYDAIGYSALPEQAHRRFDTHGLIFCGLFGLLRPTDYIPDYKLPIGVTLSGKVGSLVRYWQEMASHELDSLLKGKAVLNLLPQAYNSILNPGVRNMKRQVSIKFVRISSSSGLGKEEKIMSHDSKKLRGLLVRKLMAEEFGSTGDLGEIDLHGYRLDPSRSEDDGRNQSLTFVFED